MADNTIDRLSLEVSSDASKAVGGIDRLVRTLDRLSTSVNGIDTTKFYDLSNGLNRLGNIKFDPKPITNMLNAITRLGGKSATQAEQNIPKLTSLLSALVTEINNVGGVNFDTGGLTDLVSSVSKLGGKGATNAIPKQLRQNIMRGMRYNAENCFYNGHKMLGYKPEEGKKANRKIIVGIFSESTQQRLSELEKRKKDIQDSIEAETAKRELLQDQNSIQHRVYPKDCVNLQTDVR